LKTGSAGCSGEDCIYAEEIESVLSEIYVYAGARAYYYFSLGEVETRAGKQEAVTYMYNTG
jgi:hypothetical protein